MDPNTQPQPSPPQEPFQQPTTPLGPESLPAQPAPQAQPEFQQPAQPMQQAPSPAPQPYVGPTEHNPGQTLGIISIVLDIVGFSVIGIVLGVLSRKKSKAAGQSTTLGTIGMVLGIIFTVLGFLFLLLITLTAYAGIQERAKESAQRSSEQSSLFSE